MDKVAKKAFTKNIHLLFLSSNLGRNFSEIKLHQGSFEASSLYNDAASMHTLKRVKLKCSEFIAQNLLKPFQSASCELLFKKRRRRGSAVAAEGVEVAWAQFADGIFTSLNITRIFSVDDKLQSSFDKSSNLQTLTSHRSQVTDWWRVLQVKSLRLWLQGKAGDYSGWSECERRPIMATYQLINQVQIASICTTNCPHFNIGRKISRWTSLF